MCLKTFYPHIVPFLLPQPPPERIMHAENLSTMTAAQKSILKYYNKLVAQYPHIPSFDILWDYGNRSGIQSTFSTNTTTTTTAGNGEDGALNNDNNNNDSDNNMDESSPPSTSTKNNPDAQVIISSLHHFGAFLLHLHHSFSSPSLSTIRNYLSEFKRLLESKNSKIDLFRRRYDPWFKNLMVKYAGVSTASRRGMAPLNTSSSSSSSYTSATTTATTRLGKQIKEAAATKIKETGGDGDEDEDDEDIRMTGLIYDYDDDESDDDDVHYKEFTTTLHTRRHLHPLSRNPVFVVKEHWDSLTKNQQKVLSHYNRYRTTIRAETSSGNDGGGGEEDNNGQSLLPTFDELWLMAHRHGISSSSSSSTTISSSSSATSAINDTETTTSSPNIHHTIKHIYSRFAGYLYDQFLETGSPTFVGARVYLSNFRRLIQGHKSSAVVFNQDCDDGDDGGGGGGEDKGKAATAVEVMDHEKNIKEKKKGDLKEVEEEAGWVKKIRTQLKEKYGEKHVESSIRNSQEAGSIVEEYAANSVTTSRDVLKASKRLAKKVNEPIVKVH